MESALIHDDMIPFVSNVKVIALLLSLYLGSAVYIKSAPALRTTAQNSRLGTRALLGLTSVPLLMLLVTSWSFWPRPHYFNHHPIDNLVDKATTHSAQWLAQASSGLTLNAAVTNYVRRYGRAPPPAFDVWYRYATERSTLIIDDYDSMYEDLLPFWGLSPAEIRLLTQRLSTDPWNDIASIEIRSGEAKVGPNNKPTHQWMVDALSSMMSQFIHHIPDMDLALNLNDEPRVAVPHGMMQRLLKDAMPLKLPSSIQLSTNWTTQRVESWRGDENLANSRSFISYSGVESFSASTVACPSLSAARNYHEWDPKPMCSSCAGPHSQGGVLSNWSISASPCHQPDIRNLHGLYLTPASLKLSYQLLPVFSQSKVPGFADILYPSPWNYIDKAKYDPRIPEYPDPPFSEKLNSVFWRGATSEGLSRSGEWKGMTRQRLVHVANNLSSSSSTPMLLPDPLREGRYSIQYPSRPYQHVAPTLNISFVSIERAWDDDGAAQERYFSLGQSTDFQEHWRHRYLFDTDGAGFSGRFIAFLQSRSLPFRSGIFRAWYDGRLTAWAHFVPIDIRLQGFFSTLAYFAGTNGIKGAKTLKARVGMERKEKVAEKIAEQGREWAGKVLRKEDMEIYLFRLLIEWGRLTDDNRDNLGFALGEE